MGSLQILDETEFAAAHEAYHQAVLETPEIGLICSRQEWLLPACKHLHRSPRSRITRLEQSWLSLCESPLPSGEILYHALETVWGFSSALIGSSIEGKLELLREARSTLNSRSLLLISGIVQGSDFATEAKKSFGDDLDWFPQNVSSVIADFNEGLDVYLSRRPPSLRKSLKLFSNRANSRGISFQAAQTNEAPAALFQRILNIESRSWKSRDGESIFQTPDYRNFYAELLERCQLSGILRLLFARSDESDVAYCFGAKFGDEYRGFQMSFDEDFRSLALGNGLQWKMMENCFAEGVRRYDFGMYAPYKTNWADEQRLMISGVLR